MVTTEEASLLTQIEQIRATNNRHWMDLVRLAMNRDPDGAKALLRQIAECDQRVRTLTEQLAK